METNDKIELNKKIRKYDGGNSFLISLQKQLKTSKYLQKVEVGNKQVRILSDNQYSAAATILE